MTVLPLADVPARSRVPPPPARDRALKGAAAHDRARDTLLPIGRGRRRGLPRFFLIFLGFANNVKAIALFAFLLWVALAFVGFHGIARALGARVLGSAPAPPEAAVRGTGAVVLQALSGPEDGRLY